MKSNHGIWIFGLPFQLMNLRKTSKNNILLFCLKHGVLAIFDFGGFRHSETANIFSSCLRRSHSDVLYLSAAEASKTQTIREPARLACWFWSLSPAAIRSFQRLNPLRTFNTVMSQIHAKNLVFAFGGAELSLHFQRGGLGGSVTCACMFLAEA